MAYVQMDVAPTQEGGTKEFAFEYSESLSTAGDSKIILIPDDIQNISVIAKASGTTITVYTSTDLVSVVKSETGITWVAWYAGGVSTATAATFFPVTAIKATQAGAGSSKIMIRCQ